MLVKKHNISLETCRSNKARRFLIALLFFVTCATALIGAFNSAADAAEVTLAWDVGQISDIGGYKLYSRQCLLDENCPLSMENSEVTTIPLSDLGQYQSSPQYTVHNLSDEHKFAFAVTVYNNSGEESELSNQVVFTPPNAPDDSTNPNPDDGNTPVNQPPEVDAGQDQTIDIGTDAAEITLNGTVTDDGLPEESDLTYEWKGPDTAEIETPSELTTKVTVTQPGTYTFELTANDGELTASDTVVITVNATDSENSDDNPPPPTDDSDSDNDSDGQEIDMEVGQVQINHDWTHVTLANTFQHPIVVASPLSHKGSDPAVVRIRNVAADGFDIRIQEWDYLDGKHVIETASYLVIEQGQYQLSDGTRLEAAVFKTNATSVPQPISFIQACSKAPVVMTTITSFNESDAVAGRVQSITPKGFEYRVQEQEANKPLHVAETIAYLAWEPSTGSIGDLGFLVTKTAKEVKHKYFNIMFPEPFAATPAFLSDMQSTNGADTANIRHKYLDGFAVDVMIDEEQSLNRETRHVKEVVGYMVFGQFGGK